MAPIQDNQGARDCATRGPRVLLIEGTDGAPELGERFTGGALSRVYTSTARTHTHTRTMAADECDIKTARRCEPSRAAEPNRTEPSSCDESSELGRGWRQASDSLQIERLAKCSPCAQVAQLRRRRRRRRALWASLSHSLARIPLHRPASRQIASSGGILKLRDGSANCRRQPTKWPVGQLLSSARVRTFLPLARVCLSSSFHSSIHKAAVSARADQRGRHIGSMMAIDWGAGACTQL